LPDPFCSHMNQSKTVVDLIQTVLYSDSSHMGISPQSLPEGLPGVSCRPVRKRKINLILYHSF
jgi:hypothetical protein